MRTQSARPLILSFAAGVLGGLITVHPQTWLNIRYGSQGGYSIIGEGASWV